MTEGIHTGPRGFTDPDGQRWLLVGSHTSTVKVGERPAVKAGCAGCRNIELTPDAPGITGTRAIEPGDGASE